MGFRLRKSINLGGGVRLNVSKRGVGVSAGVKGARIGIGPRGTRVTTSIPGTGLSYQKEYSARHKGTAHTEPEPQSLGPVGQCFMALWLLIKIAFFGGLLYLIIKILISFTTSI